VSETPVSGAAPGEHVDVAFPVLDTLRAVGAIAVLTTHVTFWSGDYTRHGAWGTLFARLDVGVALFFVLSGFLLSREFLVRAAAGRPAPGVGRYFWKRFLRIAPVYVLTVVLALWFIDANAGLDAGDWITTLLLGNTFVEGLPPAGLSQMWSLAVEVTFYLVLPLLMLLAVGGRRLRPWRVVAVLAAMVATSVWWHLDGAVRVGAETEGATQQWLPSYLIWFAAGIGLALVQVLHTAGRWPGLTQRVVAVARQPGSCWAVAAGLMLVAATPLAGPALLAAPTTAQSLTKNLLYTGVGTLIVLSGVFAVRDGAYSRAFGHRFARHLGWTSYGVFCLHLPILHLVMWATGWTLFQGHGPQLWGLTLAASLVAAELVYRLVERPALRLKGLGRRPAPEPAVATAATSEASTR
jgi:peptidoglycan/LPS O-acetylase OafA/YrhL